MTTTPDYRQFLNVAIQREVDVIGQQQAISLANNVDGLSVADDGEIRSLTGSGEEVLETLVETYKETSGEVAAFVIARSLENAVEDPSVLPENLRRHI